MSFSSDKEELPDLPEIHEFRHISRNQLEDQFKRLMQLENEFKGFKKEMQTTTLGTFAQASSNTKIELHSSSSDEKSDVHDASADNKAVGCSEKVDEKMRSQEVQYELRMLVPHLSPEFNCSFQDAVLLITAVRRGHGEEGKCSLLDKITVLEAEKRSLSQRLTKKTNESEDLRSHLVGVQAKIQAIKEVEKNKNNVLSKRREEMRKQLLIEEGKVQKLNVRYKKLEVEHEELKSRMRAGLR
ncbi:unnamed protein product [Phytomonas sp. Hart1]|nr:unnamed protein product [Phytomonas sp. Hart1]|eukprot:CCW67111.1 unnamed protein product [Phytomonas sp. isolate Hart1]